MLVRADGNGRAWEPSSEADLARGGTSLMVSIVLCACIRFEVSLCFAFFFAGFKRDSPGCLGDPYGCPRQVEEVRGPPNSK
jgi:hypothetical protein